MVPPKFQDISLIRPLKADQITEEPFNLTV